jgi:hypothetical protein
MDKWKLLLWWHGCPIEYRQGVGYSALHNTQRNGCYQGFSGHPTLRQATAHIDRLIAEFGDSVKLTTEEYERWRQWKH